MTIQRLVELVELVDEFNSKVYADASLEHDKFSDSIHITMFYNNPTSSVAFYTSDGSSHENIYHGDKNLEKAEAFMRMLMKSAEYYEPMKVRY